jgi:hypothetical protein
MQSVYPNCCNIKIRESPNYVEYYPFLVSFLSQNYDHFVWKVHGSTDR